MGTTPDKYFNLSFERVVRSKIADFIGLILPDGYKVLEADTEISTNYFVCREGASENCAIINYFWSNGPMLRFSIYHYTLEGKMFMTEMEKIFGVRDEEVLRI